MIHIEMSIKPLVLKKAFTLTDIEKYLHLIAESDGVPLQLSKEFTSKRRGAMHDAARLQMLVTWARLAKDKHLHFIPTNNNTEVLEELCDYAPGISVLRLCKGVYVGEQFTPMRDAIKYAEKKMLRSDSYESSKIIKGRTVDFTFLSGSKIQYLRPFFYARSADAVKGKDDLTTLFKQLADDITTIKKNLVDVDFIKNSAIFANELITNTQEHATSDHRHHKYTEHVEGMIFSWNDLRISEYKDDFQGHPRLSEFWDRELVVDREKIQCLQLSFFDSGPGFASRFTGLPISKLTETQEIEAFKASLQRNSSTKNEIGSGNGLPLVLRSLQSTGGLVSIRSGRLHMFNEFAINDTRGIFDFDKWGKNKLAPVAGTVISILLPIRRKNNA